MDESGKMGNQVTEAEWSAFVLRSLISYHERMHMGVLIRKEDGEHFCERQQDCPAAQHDGYLKALRYALSAVEEKAKE